MQTHWRTISLACAAAMFLCMALGRFSFSTMIPALVESGAVTVAQGGYIGGLNLCGFFLGAAIAVQLAHTFGMRQVILLSVWVATLALFACVLSVGLYWLGFWRFMVGVCAGLVMVQSMTLAVTLAPVDKRAQAAGYVFAGVGLGILFSGSAVPMLLQVSIALAWTGIAVAGLLAALFVTAAVYRSLPNGPTSTPPSQSSPERAPFQAQSPAPPRVLAWYLLVAASAWFSFGIVPHTIYWFDFIARANGLGDDIAGHHWMAIGIAGIVGPLLAARLADEWGARAAAVTGFLLLAIGVGLPAFAQYQAALWISTILFGLQPGVSGLIATRVRDIGSDGQVLAMMRVVILANGVGAAAGGLLYPVLFGIANFESAGFDRANFTGAGGYSIVFLVGGIGFLIGAGCCLAPARQERQSAHRGRGERDDGA